MLIRIGQPKRISSVGMVGFLVMMIVETTTTKKESFNFDAARLETKLAP